MTDGGRWKIAWESEEFGKPYGDVFFARATGKLPEMESSKAASRRLSGLLTDGSSLLDVGCGAGHYYCSIRNAVPARIHYTGLDATRYYVERAKEAFAADTSAQFVVGDIFGLDFPDRSFDVVLCSNVLIHLPSIIRPLDELCRVARRHLLVRTLVSATSYVVMDVAPQADGDDFDEEGYPRKFHYLNIYGESYLRHLLRRNERVRDVRIELDRDFAPECVSDTARAIPQAWDATKVIDGVQMSGPILMPWSWISVDLCEGS